MRGLGVGIAPDVLFGLRAASRVNRWAAEAKKSADARRRQLHSARLPRRRSSAPSSHAGARRFSAPSSHAGAQHPAPPLVLLTCARLPCRRSLLALRPTPSPSLFSTQPPRWCSEPAPGSLAGAFFVRARLPRRRSLAPSPHAGARYWRCARLPCRRSSAPSSHAGALGLRPARTPALSSAPSPRAGALSLRPALTPALSSSAPGSHAGAPQHPAPLLVLSSSFAPGSLAGAL